MSHNSTNSYPAFTMAGKSKSDANLREMKQVPGPGQYEYRENSKKVIYKREASYGIGTSQRHDFTNSLESLMKPSPNKYLPNIAVGSNRRRDPKFSFGTGTRSALHLVRETPAANKYVIPSLAVGGPKMTIGQRNY